MHNMVYLIGRITGDVEEVERKDGTKEARINLAVQRSYKNVDGVYETDFIKCSLLNGIAQSVRDYCKKGDLVGIKGRVEVKDLEKGKSETVVVAERVSFLAATKCKDSFIDKNIE